MENLKKKIGLDYDRLARMSIIEEGSVKVGQKVEITPISNLTAKIMSHA